jgi:hypothetical protein
MPLHYDWSTDILMFFSPYQYKLHTMCRGLWTQLLNNKPWNRANAIEAAQRRIDDIMRVVPREQMLMFDVKEGWGPLCKVIVSLASAMLVNIAVYPIILLASHLIA